MAFLEQEHEGLKRVCDGRRVNGRRWTERVMGWERLVEEVEDRMI